MAHPSSNRSLPGLLIAVLVAFLLILGVSAWWVLVSPSGVRPDMTIEGTVQLIRSWGGWGVALAIALMVMHSFVLFPAEILACSCCSMAKSRPQSRENTAQCPEQRWHRHRRPFVLPFPFSERQYPGTPG
jgi:hypothetical protein